MLVGSRHLRRCRVDRSRSSNNYIIGCMIGRRAGDASRQIFIAAVLIGTKQHQSRPIWGEDERVCLGRGKTYC